MVAAGAYYSRSDRGEIPARIHKAVFPRGHLARARRSLCKFYASVPYDWPGEWLGWQDGQRRGGGEEEGEQWKRAAATPATGNFSQNRVKRRYLRRWLP